MAVDLDVKQYLYAGVWRAPNGPNVIFCRYEGATRRQRERELGVLCTASSPAGAAVNRDRVGDRRGMAALGISRRHTLRDNQGRRSRGTSRVHGGYAGGPSRVHARAGMASERDAVRCAIAVPCGTSPCQDLEPDAGSQADAP